MKNLLLLSFVSVLLSCKAETGPIQNNENPKKIIQELPAQGLPTPAADYPDDYIDLLKGKKVGIVTNHTAMVGNRHLVDMLISKGITLKAVFAPEHGFRGDADAGAKIKDGIDEATGLPIFSLYGETRKPTDAMMKDIDLLLFDIQDVGVRFYTYISTMHYTMEAAADKKIPYIVLDRPNPNGNYVDGPIREQDQISFVGMHPIPIVHGLTVGELAMMINEEGWLKNGVKCDLSVIKAKNYTHSSEYSLPVKPSPNLPNDLSIILYPSICLFEGTVISVGRGTYDAFQQIGHPSLSNSYSYYFTPESIKGMAQNPKYMGEKCYGITFKGSQAKREFTLSYLIEMYKAYRGEEPFFNNYFSKLAGTSMLREQIEKGMDETAIRETWEPGLSMYLELRAKYLLYEE